MKIQKTKNFGVPAKNKTFFTIGPSNPLRGLTHFGTGSTKNFFFNFCYLIRVEHKKRSEMCVRIVRFGLKLIKWTIFSEKLTFSKKVHLRVYKLPYNPCLSTRECPKILKICQDTKFDMGFQKKKHERPKFEYRFF
jgi:hypothetical protein